MISLLSRLDDIEKTPPLNPVKSTEIFTSGPDDIITPFPIIVYSEWDLNGKFYWSWEDSEIDSDIETIGNLVSSFNNTYSTRIAFLDDIGWHRLFKLHGIINEKIDRIKLCFKLFRYQRIPDAQKDEFNRKEKLCNEKINQLVIQMKFLRNELYDLGENKILELANNSDLEIYKNWFLNILSKKKYYIQDPEKQGVVNTLKQELKAMVNEYYNLWRSIFSNESYQEIKARLSSPEASERERASNELFKKLGDSENQDKFATILNLVFELQIKINQIYGYETPYSQTFREDRIKLNVFQAVQKGLLGKDGSMFKKLYEIKGKVFPPTSNYDSLIDFSDVKVTLPVSETDLHLDVESLIESLQATLNSINPGNEDFIDKLFASGKASVFSSTERRSGWFCFDTNRDGPFVLLDIPEKEEGLNTYLAGVAAHEFGHAFLATKVQEAGLPQQVYEPPYYLHESMAFIVQIFFSLNQIEKAEGNLKINLLEKFLQDIIFFTEMNALDIKYVLKVYGHVENGETLTAEALNNLWNNNYKELNEGVVGPQNPDNPNVNMDWIRTFNFFEPDYHFYSLKWILGMCLALNFYKLHQDSSESERPELTTNFLKILAESGSKNPQEVLAEIGMDIEGPEFYKNAMSVVESLLNDYEKLQNERIAELNNLKNS
jgi:oligoendopeptidase F